MQVVFHAAPAPVVVHVIELGDCAHAVADFVREGNPYRAASARYQDDARACV